MEEIEFSEAQKDVLKEIGTICAGNAATALSQLIKKRVEINVPDIYFMPVESVPKVVGEEKLVVGLVVRILGDFPSVILLVFSGEDAWALASLLTGKDPADPSPIGKMEHSALKEIGVILANAYLGALSVFIRWGLVPTVPEIIEDMAGAMVDSILIELSNISNYALLIKSEFKETTTRVMGHFFLIPNLQGLEVILKATEI